MCLNPLLRCQVPYFRTVSDTVRKEGEVDQLNHFLPFESKPDSDASWFENPQECFMSKEVNGEPSLVDFPSNDSSRGEIASMADRLPGCFLGPAMTLHELYGEEAVALHSFQDVLRVSCMEFELGNVQQRALDSAAIPGTRRLCYDAIAQNDAAFSSDPLAFIQSVNAMAAPRRLSVERIITDFPYATTFSEWHRLQLIAAGVGPPLSENFIPSLGAATVRSSMRKIQPALNVLANVIVERQEGFVVSADVFRSTVSRLGLVAHLSELWHIGKPDQDLGRLLFDYSNLTGATPINTPQSRLQLIDTFGELKMPTLVRLYVVAEELAVVYPNKASHACTQRGRTQSIPAHDLDT
jgi:hypothetical protein